MELIIIGFLFFIIYNFFSKKEGGTVEKVQMKMSSVTHQATYDYLININCPYCESGLSIPEQGAWICYKCEEVFVYYKSNIYKNEDIHSIIAILVVAILAKFSKANGVVTKEHLNIVEENIKRYFDASDKQMNELKKIFNTEIKILDNYEEVIIKLHDLIKNNLEVKNGVGMFLIEIMFQLEIVDNNGETGSEKYNEIIFKVVQIFNIDMKSYESLKGKHIKDLNHYYNVLECNRNATLEEVKNQYRKLSKKYHPDIYASKDLPQEIIDLTAAKFREINDAYEIITSKLKSKVNNGA